MINIFHTLGFDQHFFKSLKFIRVLVYYVMFYIDFCKELTNSFQMQYVMYSWIGQCVSSKLL